MSKVSLEYLTWLLRRAVPDARVESVSLIKTASGLYWIRVDPDHYMYWRHFRKAYPHWVRAARTYKATRESIMIDGFCPEFAALESLFKWLFDVLELARGERNLLLLLHKRLGECHGC